MALKIPVAEDEQRRGLLPLLLLLLLMMMMMMTMILLKREEGCLPEMGAVGRQGAGAAAAAQTRQQAPLPLSLQSHLLRRAYEAAAQPGRDADAVSRRHQQSRPD